MALNTTPSAQAPAPRHQGLETQAVEEQLSAERTHYERLLKALAGAKVVLDSACGFVINR
jgi:ATP-dependent helicase HepA